ncbi:zinc-ribbon domain-containing protein [Yoonia sp. SS1-5]|uniref:Zinc-ribbon domain-containing protein n=1 Tax=Yoonia rhodophyticola TaxID=3137370 RepID=A0AAN0NM44_9RHOB
MRLICPNCDAQYDISDDVIPEGGRDVQCSSCAHTWFQTDKPKVPGRPTPPPMLDMADGPKRVNLADRPRHRPVEDAPTRKPLESSIADILREEAARENAMPETQGSAPHPSEMGKSSETRAAETRRRIAEMTDGAATPAAIAAAATGAVAGRDVHTVPSIDEINATLSARALASDRSGLTEEEHYEVVQRRGFRRGFFLMLLLVALLITPYFFADQITQNLPQTSDVMAQYVSTVDQIRVWLNDQADTIRGMIDNALNGDPAAADPSTAPAATE